MILRLKFKPYPARKREVAISSMTQRAGAARAACPSADLVHAAMTQSSIAIAVCDHDFTVRFFNDAIGRLIGRVAASPLPALGGLPGMAMLGLLGIDDVVTVSDIMSHGGWRGIASLDASGDPGPRPEVHVAVEAFREGDRPAGWIITASDQIAQPARARPSDQALIASSDKLTARECEVMLALQEGASNKAIARRLEISPRTVEFHRARIMQRFAAKSIVDLVRRVTTDAHATLLSGC
jgi:DNA-binding NarL/FixJ family response regulator